MGSVVVGVDGCKLGWLAAIWNPQARTLDWKGYADLATLLKAFPDATIGIDMPLGLWDQGDRPGDREARRMLGKPRSSSVFAPPIPSILDCRTFAEANESSKRAIGKGISQQAFGLFPKLREANATITPDIQYRVFELHPEVSFCGLAEDAMVFPKRTEAGFDERRNLLNTAMNLRQPILSRSEVARSLRDHGAQPDDVLDAAIAAWTAHRVATGTAVRLRGDAVYRGANGLVMEIVY